MKLAIRIFGLSIAFLGLTAATFPAASASTFSLSLSASKPKPKGLPVPICGPGIPCGTSISIVSQ